MLLWLWLECYIITIIISVMKCAKWLLNITCFEEDIFKLKIEHVPMCMCPCFHNKPMQFECL